MPSLSYRWMLALLVAGIVSPRLGAQAWEAARLVPPGGQRGTEVQVNLPGKWEAWPVQVWSSHPGIVWRAEEAPGNLRATIAPDIPLGPLGVRLFSGSGASKRLRFVVGELPERMEIEPNDDYLQPQTLDGGNQTVQGVLQKSGDVDHFAFESQAGQLWTVTLDAHRGLGSPMDGCLQLLDARGHVLAQNLDRFGLDPGLRWVCPREGSYRVRVFAFPETPDSTIGYAGGDAFQYRLRCMQGDDPSWDAVFLEGAVAIQEPNDRLQPMVWMANPAPGEANATMMPLVVAGQMDAPGDEDALRVVTPQAGHFKIAVRALEFGSAMDAVIEVLDRDGKSLAKQGESGAIQDPALANQMTEPGEYTVVVRDLHRGWGPSHRYRLELTDERPEVRGTLAKDVILGKVGQPISVEVGLDRTLGCKAEATLVAVGLPEGTQVAQATSRPDDDTAKKVLLTWTPDRACSIPLRIEIRPPDRTEPGWVLATDSQQVDLWLVVTESP